MIYVNFCDPGSKRHLSESSMEPFHLGAELDRRLDDLEAAKRDFYGESSWSTTSGIQPLAQTCWR